MKLGHHSPIAEILDVPALPGNLYSISYYCAAALEQNCVAPDAVHLSDAPAATNFAKAARLVQGETARVLRKHSGLQSPDTVLLGFIDEGLK